MFTLNMFEAKKWMLPWVWITLLIRLM